MYKTIIRPIFFLFDPEKIHHFTFGLLGLLQWIPGMMALNRKLFKVRDPGLRRTCFGIEFDNPVGLAAGFDKDALRVDELASYGFGFIEIGTVTPLGQPGNPKPRLFRLPKDKAVINRMGFNNDGVNAVAERLSKRKSDVVIGGNLGKNKITPNEEAVNDYLKGFEALYDYVDYFVVNVSSPNTPNLRDLQDKEPLKRLLLAIEEKNALKPVRRPVLLKIAPDLTEGQLDDIIQIVQETKLDGLIATNTTISRKGLSTSETEVAEIGNGGLSGHPVKDRSNEVLKYLRSNLGNDFPIIGVGGIMSPEDAWEKMRCGATLVQIYTGFIYEGPAFVRDINRYLVKQLGTA